MSRNEKRQEAARKRNLIVDEMQAIVAHELRNCQSIMGAFRRVAEFVIAAMKKHPREKSQYERALVEYRDRCRV